MKEHAIEKINKIGKVGFIISKIATVCVGIGLALCLIVTLMTAFIPKNFFNIGWKTTATVNLDLSKIEKYIPELKDEDNVTKALTAIQEDGSFESSNDEYVVSNFAYNNGIVTVNAESAEVSKVNNSQLFGLMVCITVYLTAIMISVIFISAFCKALYRCQSPFDELVIKKLTYFAYSLIPWAILEPMKDSVFNFCVGNTSAVNFVLNFNNIIVVLAVLAIAYVFKYGAVLQQESDETL